MNKPAMSAAALQGLAAYMPIDLTQKQVDQVINGATEVYEAGLQEGRAYQSTIERVRRENTNGGAG